MHNLTLAQLKTAHESGGIVSASVVADGPAFQISLETQNGQAARLVLTRSQQARMFRDPGKALALLRDIGILVGRFDTSGWTPEAGGQKQRPDSSRKMREVHASANLVASLQSAVDEADADDRPDISHDDVMARLDRELVNIAKGSSK